MAPDSTASKSRVRTRAPRACTQCSQRKVLCDGAEIGIPCSRCRADRSAECIFLPSRRGTYTRKKKASASARGSGHHDPSSLQRDATRPRNAAPPADAAATRGAVATRDNWRYPGVDGRVAPDDGANPHVPDGYADDNSCTTSPAPRWPVEPEAAQHTSTSVASASSRAPLQRSSLAAMFEDYLDSQGPSYENVLKNRGIIFLADSSPLTFALEELRRDKTLHDISSQVADKESENEEGLAGPQGSTHPAHMSVADTAYLKAKGAFEFPQNELLSALVSAFMDKFYPLYSIVNRTKFEQLYEQQKLPWILLHAVCFIGATYCDQGVIHRSRLKSRWHARRHFYDKAKVLFDLGYETDKIILLQTVLLLTFWGPQMKSYWNPCSWIGFGVTIADSLGIYKSNSAAHLPPADRSLLRRLWWTLAVRDAYCAALLGRPFRINMARSDTEPLSLDDFSQDGGSLQAAPTGNSYTGALYQVQIAKLSLILRQIILSKSKEAYDSQTMANLHILLNDWQSDLPEVVDWRKPSSPPTLCATSLKIIFHHHLIVIHLGEPHSGLSAINYPVDMDSPSLKIAESAAQTIASSAFALMTSSMVGSLPHEVFPGFLIAGIVFYRQMKNCNGIMAQLGQAALDNCQMVMNEARESWDAAQWALRIFDFLVSRSSRMDPQGDRGWQPSTTPAQDFSMSQNMPEPGAAAAQPHVPDTAGYDFPATLDVHSFPNEDLRETVNEIMLMPDYFMTAADYDFDIPF
ncbi:Nn.00g054820.m01.CDS01 [Neocucurbitaria sp. VM-36]